MKGEITWPRSLVKTIFTLMSNPFSLPFFVPDHKVTPLLPRSLTGLLGLKPIDPPEDRTERGLWEIRRKQRKTDIV